MDKTDLYSQRWLDGQSGAIEEKKPKKKVGGLKGFLANALPFIGSTIGAVGGSVVAPVAGTVAGGAAGGGLGEFLKQKILGEETDIKKIGIESALGAVPGVFKGVGATVNAARGASAAVKAAEGATALGGVASISDDVVRGVTKGVKPSELLMEKTIPISKELNGATKAATKPGGIFGKLDNVGKDLQQGVANPKVSPSPFGASQEKEIAKALSDVPGLSAKTKYKNLQPAMEDLSTQIESKLATTKGTVPKSDFVKKLQNDVLENGNYLDPTNEAHLRTLESQINRFTKGLPEELSAKDVFNLKKELSSSIGGGFDKLQTGEATNALKQAQYDLWGQLDNRITEMAPEVKELTTKQSRLIQAASGLKKGSEKTLGVPLLGIKSQRAEQLAQGVSSVAGKTLSNEGGGKVGELLSGLTTKTRGGESLLGQGTKQLLEGGIVRAAIPGEEPTSDVSDEAKTEVDSIMGDTAIDPSLEEATPEDDSPFGATNIQKAIIADLANGGKNVSTLMKLYETFGKTTESEGLNSTAAGNVTDLENGIVNIGSLSDEFDENGSNIPVIGNLLAKIPGNTNAQTLQADVARVKQVIGKALEGGVLRKEDEEKYAKILPTLNDTDAVAQYKIKQIAGDLNRKLAFYKKNLGKGGGGNDAASLLQMQQSY